MIAQTTEGAALELTGQIAANAELAPPILELLKAAKNDPTALAALTKRALEPTQAELPVASSQATIQELDSRASIIVAQGGIFIGKAELVRLGKIKDTDVVPAIPEKYSTEFFEATHPIRGGTIASHCILGFDVKSQQWFCIDRGEGGASDIVPGSLGPKSQGLSGDKQDALLLKDGKSLEVSGCRIESPKDSYAVEQILDAAIAIHLKDGKSIETAPFRGIYGRTADTERGASGCRVLLGGSNEDGVSVRDPWPGDLAYYHVGLLAAWN